MVFGLETVTLFVLQAAAAEAAPVAEPMIPPPPMMATSSAPTEPNQQVVPVSRYQLWVRSRQYPIDARIEKREGKTKVRLAVDTDGKVQSCAVLESSGHADLDKATCDQLKDRARFRPATDANAEPIASTYDHTVTWKIRDAKEPAGAANVVGNDAAAQAVIEAATEVPLVRSRVSSLPKAPRVSYGNWNQRGLNDYPAGALERGTTGSVRVALLIDADGKLTDCSVVESIGDADLDEASCDGASELKIQDPAMDVNGEPTAGKLVRNITWWLPKDETVVYSARAYQRRPTRLPYIENGMIGVTMETKADGSVVSCEAIKEGELPKEFDFVEKACDEIGQNKVYFVKDFTNRNAEIEEVGSKVRFEVRMTASRVDDSGTTEASPTE